MSQAQDAKKVKQNQHLLYKMVLALCITFSLMMIWLNQFEETENQATSASFKVITNEFRNAVNLTHVEWLRLARADTVKLYTDLQNPDEFSQVRMNKKGWPAVIPANATGCAKLWQAILKQPLQVIHQTIKVQYQDKSCKFELNAKHFLVYRIDNGQVNYYHQGVN